jgi:hypothetical protein
MSGGGGQKVCSMSERKKEVLKTITHRERENNIKQTYGFEKKPVSHAVFPL